MDAISKIWINHVGPRRLSENAYSTESGHSFQTKPAAESTRNRPPSPVNPATSVGAEREQKGKVANHLLSLHLDTTGLIGDLEQEHEGGAV